MKSSQWTSATLVAALIFGGTLVPAGIAQVAPPPPPPAVLPPPPPGALPPPPEAVPPPPPAVVPPPPRTSPIREPGRGAEVGAAFLNVVHVPGKALVCGAGTVASAVIMLATFGSAYGAAVDIFNEGCAGHWLLTPYDVAAIRPPEDR